MTFTCVCLGFFGTLFLVLKTRIMDLALLLNVCFVVSQISFRPGGMQNPGPNIPKVR